MVEIVANMVERYQDGAF